MHFLNLTTNHFENLKAIHHFSYLQNRSISPKRPFFHNRKPMQKGDIAAVQRDPKDKTRRLRTAGNQSNESDGRFAPILGRDAPRSRRSGGCSSAG